MPITNTQPFLWHRDSAYQVTPGEPGVYKHCFGGSLELAVANFPEGQRPLHRLLTLDLTDPRLKISLPDVRFLPLLYGFAFSGCEMRYRVLSDAEVLILELSPMQSSEKWPYADYPKYFEPLPVALSEPEQLTLEQVGELTWQGTDDATEETAIVVVPPSAAYGVSLWGDGDAEEVQVVFSDRDSDGQCLCQQSVWIAGKVNQPNSGLPGLK